MKVLAWAKKASQVTTKLYLPPGKRAGLAAKIVNHGDSDGCSRGRAHRNLLEIAGLLGVANLPRQKLTTRTPANLAPTAALVSLADVLPQLGHLEHV